MEGRLSKEFYSSVSYQNLASTGFTSAPMNAYQTSHCGTRIAASKKDPRTANSYLTGHSQ
jgi:hypothetical protein